MEYSGWQRNTFLNIIEHLNPYKYQFQKNARDWEKVECTPKGQLSLAIKDLIITEKLLKEKKLWCNNIKKDLSEDWKELNKKAQELKEKFIKMDQFVKDNQRKRNRAMKSIEKLKNKQKVCLNMITDLEKMEKDLSNVKTEMEKQCQNLKMYKEFLDKVVADDEIYKEPVDILNKYETLDDTKIKLKARLDLLLENIENLNEEMIHIKENHYRKIFTLKMQIVKLEEKLREVRKECIHWESEIYKNKLEITQQIAEREKIHAACWNVYILLNQRTRQPILASPETIMYHLKSIKQGVDALRKMCFLSETFANEKSKNTNEQSKLP